MTHYDVLGVAPDATAAAIRQAFRDQARRAHPDVAAPSAVSDMAAINEAWSVLGDPHRRAAYDRALRQELASAGEPPHDGRSDGGGGDVPVGAVLSRTTQGLLRRLLVTAILLVLVMLIVIFLIGFGRVGA